MPRPAKTGGEGNHGAPFYHQKIGKLVPAAIELLCNEVVLAGQVNLLGSSNAWANAPPMAKAAASSATNIVTSLPNVGRCTVAEWAPCSLCWEGS